MKTERNDDMNDGPREEKPATCGVEFSMSTTSGREAYKAWATSEATEQERDAAWYVAQELRKRALAELAGTEEPQ